MKEYLKSLLELYDRKNAAYGNSTHITYYYYGKSSYITRLSDKFNRLSTLIKDENINCCEESILDTIDDAILYLFMFAGDMITGYPDGELDDCYAENDDNVAYTKLIISSITQLDTDLCETLIEKFKDQWLDDEEDMFYTLRNMYVSDAGTFDYINFALYLINFRLNFERRNID